MSKFYEEVNEKKKNKKKNKKMCITDEEVLQNKIKRL